MAPTSHFINSAEITYQSFVLALLNPHILAMMTYPAMMVALTVFVLKRSVMTGPTNISDTFKFRLWAIMTVLSLTSTWF
jgi:hypothetical protein